MPKKMDFMELAFMPVDWSKAKIVIHDKPEDYEKGKARLVLTVPLTKKEVVKDDD